MLITPGILSKADAEVPNENVGIYLDELTKIIVNTPGAVLTIALAYVSGHVWTYIVFAFITKRERRILSSKLGKMGLGILWFAVVSTLLKFIVSMAIGSGGVDLVGISVISCALQAVILAIIWFFQRRE